MHTSESCVEHAYAELFGSTEPEADGSRRDAPEPWTWATAVLRTSLLRCKGPPGIATEWQ